MCLQHSNNFYLKWHSFGNFVLSLMTSVGSHNSGMNELMYSLVQPICLLKVCATDGATYKRVPLHA